MIILASLKIENFKNLIINYQTKELTKFTWICVGVFFIFKKIMLNCTKKIANILQVVHIIRFPFDYLLLFAFTFCIGILASAYRLTFFDQSISTIDPVLMTLKKMFYVIMFLTMFACGKQDDQRISREDYWGFTVLASIIYFLVFGIFYGQWLLLFFCCILACCFVCYIVAVSWAITEKNPYSLEEDDYLLAAMILNNSLIRLLKGDFDKLNSDKNSVITQQGKFVSQVYATLSFQMLFMYVIILASLIIENFKNLIINSQTKQLTVFTQICLISILIIEIIICVWKFIGESMSMFFNYIFYSAFTFFIGIIASAFCLTHLEQSIEIVELVWLTVVMIIQVIMMLTAVACWNSDNHSKEVHIVIAIIIIIIYFGYFAIFIAQGLWLLLSFSCILACCFVCYIVAESWAITKKNPYSLEEDDYLLAAMILNNSLIRLIDDALDFFSQFVFPPVYEQT